MSGSIAIWGAGIVGALALYISRIRFWFSAVEGEVYAMSSLFTAAVFWAMLRVGGGGGPASCKQVDCSHRIPYGPLDWGAPAEPACDSGPGIHLLL
jgi:hypothetical protein